MLMMNMLGLLLVMNVVVVGVTMLVGTWGKLYRGWHNNVTWWGSARVLLAIDHRAMIPLLGMKFVVSKIMEMAFHYWHGVHHTCWS